MAPVPDAGPSVFADDEGDVNDFYKLLGVGREAGDEEIRRGYLKAALRWHPDKNRDNEERAENRFKLVAAAYQVLSDPEQRDIYDREGVGGLNSSGFFEGEDIVISTDMAFRFFRWMFPDLAPYAAFSDAKLQELFPDLFGRGRLPQTEEQPSSRL